MPRDSGGPRGATGSLRPTRGSGAREIDDAASTRGKKVTENDGRSTTITTNLRQIALECNGGFFESFRDGAGTRRCPWCVRPTHVAYVTRTNCTNFLHKLLPSLLFLHTPSTARLAVRGLSARRFYHLSSTHMPYVQLL